MNMSENNALLKDVVIAYNQCITRQDIKSLADHLDEAYVFIDSAGTRIEGKQNGIETWKKFFLQFPDYRNEFETIRVFGDDEVVVTGRSVCSYEPLDGPALWRAKVTDGRVLEWQVYEDTPAARAELGL